MNKITPNRVPRMIDWPLEIIHSKSFQHRFSNYADSGRVNGISSDDAHSLWYPTILNENTHKLKILRVRKEAITRGSRLYNGW